jgi:sugar phosphate isomerase/epimerase
MIAQLLRKRTLTLFAVLLTLALQAQDRFGGLALYTVRDDMSKNAVETLKAVADAGYAYVEAAGYNDGKFYGMDPKDFKKTLKEVGLEPVSTHQGGLTLENADQMIADVKAAGFKYFVIPVPPMGHFKVEDGKMGMSDELELLTDVLNTVGKKCKAAGLELLYHNHDFEFVKNSKGIIPIEYFLENTDPGTVNFEMDLYWVTRAGADPVAYFEKYPGRFKLWHVKDMDEEGKFAPVGTGSIDFSRILKEKDKSGMIYYYVEQDRTWDKKPLEVIKTSHEGLKKFGFNESD